MWELDESDFELFSSEWKSKIHKLRIQNIDFQAAFEKAQEEIGKEENIGIFQSMRLMHRPEQCPSIVTVHAGVTEDDVSQLDEMCTATVGDLIENGDLLDASSRPTFFLRRHRQPEQKLLPFSVTTSLIQQQILLVIHGHDSQSSGAHDFSECHLLDILNCDIELSRGMNGKKNNWGYAQIQTDGKFVIASKKQSAERIIGEVQDGVFCKVEGYYLPL